MSLVFMLKWTERKMREMRGPEKAGTGVDGQPLSEIQPEP
jgi:hypothetical protein